MFLFLFYVFLTGMASFFTLRPRSIQISLEVTGIISLLRYTFY